MIKYAFPASVQSGSAMLSSGLTKQEYVASQALAALISTWPNDLASADRIKNVTTNALALADALLKLTEATNGNS